MAGWQRRAKDLLRIKAHPVWEAAYVFKHPCNRGHRLRAVARAARFRVASRWLKRPCVAQVGAHSRIIAYPGETNSRHAFRHNPPNWPQMGVWQQYLEPGDLFVDVGANIGIYTIFAKDLGAEVVAVEPTPNADRVRENLALNGYGATVLQKAVADRPGRLRMTDDLDSFNHLIDDPDRGIVVEATTLDDVLADRTARVKIDVEGAERLVLEGAGRALSEHRITMMQIEWAPRRAMLTLGGTLTPVADILRKHDYVLYWADRAAGLHALQGDTSPTTDVFAFPRELAPAVS